MKVSGTFEVELKPLEAYAGGGDEPVSCNRMSIDKRFSGGLTGQSKGEMLSAMTPVKGSAGYVAIERVKGTLSGKSGSFVLQHFGTMNKGEERLILEVIPDSGTGELQGLSGSMNIIRESGRHEYEFEYELE